MQRSLRNAISVASVLAFGAVAEAQIDFTPTITHYTSEGAEYSSVQFKDDKRRVSLILPRLWSCSGDASKLQIVPPNQSFAEGIIQAVPTKEVLRFDETALKNLQQQVLATLPPGSQGATLVSQQENPVLLNQNLSYEFVVSYQNLGRTFQRNVIFVNCPGQQLIFRFSAPKDIYAPLYAAFRQSLYSWEWKDSALPTAAGPVTASK
jgi:hypothetical protein